VENVDARVTEERLIVSSFHLNPCGAGYALLWLVLALSACHAHAEALAVPNGGLESPAVGSWSTTKPASWTWSAGSGCGSVGLTSTCGAKNSRQTLYGNQIAGTLTSDVLPQTLPGPEMLTLSDSAKKCHDGQ
jgi:hypothetical protein